MTVLDNLTDSDGINALDNLSFSFATIDLQTKLAGYYAFDGYSSPTLERIISVFHLPTFNTQRTFNDSHGAVQFTNASNNFNLLVIIPSLLGEGFGDAFGYNPSSEWKHVVVMSDGNAFVDTNPFLYNFINLGFQGEIDELKIFNTLLESSQIEELFINRSWFDCYYPFNADNGTSHPLLDLSGQDNDLRGSPSLVDGFSGSPKQSRVQYRPRFQSR